MPDNSDPIRTPSWMQIEFLSEKDEYLELIDTFENIARSVLQEPGVSNHLRLDEEPPAEFLHLKGRATKAVEAISSVRMLRKWQADAELAGDAYAERFYHIAHRAFRAAMASAMVAPTFTELEATDAQLAKGRSKGGNARQEPFKVKEAIIRTELERLWLAGERFQILKLWSKAVVAARPEFTPETERGWERLDRLISKIGKETFRDEWPI
jgi:hypothetical protein